MFYENIGKSGSILHKSDEEQLIEMGWY